MTVIAAIEHRIPRIGTALLAAGLLILGACAPVSKTRDDTPSGPLVYPQPPDEPRFYYERTLYGSGDVVAKKDRDLKGIITGEGSESGKGMKKPYGISVAKGRVFVTDLGGVHVFDIPGKQYSRIGEASQAEKDESGLQMPLGIDFDAEGNLYVVDAATTSKSVQVYDQNGHYLRSFGGAKVFHRPSGIAVDKATSRVYVVDGGGIDTKEHRVRVFDGKNGSHLFDFGKRGTAEGEFNLPRDATFGKNGMLYVVDGGNFRVQVFSPEGKFSHTFGSLGRLGGMFARPKEIAADRDGNVYVIDAAFANFQIFDASGKLLLPIGNRSGSDQPGHFMLPSGIAVDDDGRVYVVDQYFRKVDVFRPASLNPQ